MIQLGIKIRAISADLLHYSAVASEPLESASKAPAAEVAVLVLEESGSVSGIGVGIVRVRK